MTTTTTRPLQAQENAARFASRADTTETAVRHDTVRTALALLRGTRDTVGAHLILTHGVERQARIAGLGSLHLPILGD
ncbi:hypothetical protein [Nocardioides sp.]|uniref:hypothetical protein n=1 Tax=Nocardioides sp. TaxID=35761 RepID=UPI002621C789|nr:hypothetical protein [Nocardioides sp.]MDI6911462.1 hypothetical protein [Nocardioides sp.]